MDKYCHYSKRERVLRTIRHEKTDRIPKGELCITDSIISRELNCSKIGFEEKLAFINRLDLDIFTVSPIFPHDKNRLPEPDEYEWPDIKKWASQTSVFTFALIDGAFETGLRTYGLLDFLTLPKESPDDLKNFIRQVEKLNIATMKQSADQGIDGIILADDIAYANGLLTNPNILREYFLPSLAKQVEEITHLGLPVFYHSDGNYREIIPDLMDMGIQGLQCIEQRCGMDIVALQEEYGDRLCLWGHIDTENTHSAHDVDFLKNFSASIQGLSTRNGIILGTNCGLYEGIDIEGLIAIYRTLK
ncbi:hypothetical protein HBE96_18610 [Clostridium sp. P21]|uniref:Uroporphyrinogen decarboxylase (URO-D) domain-containing protein n=1 Tax=Clostridium muellerianum TaxID=2716538 RepID=A0A7Y0HQD6_9CLOT|nr:uroporphyrinogen decarboxylase family protein [Clostridium muellerianum]NMM64622.1 hypothetical protein [Clostridium muellerianum]